MYVVWDYKIRKGAGRSAGKFRKAQIRQFADLNMC